MIIVVGGDKEHIANADKLTQVIRQPSPLSSLPSSSKASTSDTAIPSSLPASAFSTTALPATSPLEQDSEEFDKLNLNSIQDERITLMGHGSAVRFGANNNKGKEHPGYTPQELVATLKTRGLPTTVQAIDLFACEVGLTNDYGKSYAAEVAALLEKDPQYQHIKLYAFTANANLYSREITSVEKKTGKVYVFGVKKENESAYQQKSEELATIKRNLKLIDEGIKEAESMLAKRQNFPIIKESLERRITELNKQLAKTTQELAETKSVRFKLREEIASYDNYREALNNNPAYHIDPMSVSNKKRPHSPTPRLTENKSEDKPPDRIPSPDHKQVKLEGGISSQPPGEKDESTVTSASPSKPNDKDTVEYGLEKPLPQSRRVKERLNTERIAAIGQQVRESYLPKKAILKEGDQLTKSFSQKDSDKDNSSANNTEENFSFISKPR